MKKPARNGYYVLVGGQTYDARTQKERDAIRRAGWSQAVVTRWDGSQWQDTGTVLYPSEAGAAGSRSHATKSPSKGRRSHATKSPSKGRAESIALGTKWAEDRFRQDPDYAAFTLDMVSIDPAEVPSAKKREVMKNLICATAVKRWRELRDQRRSSSPVALHDHATRKTPPSQLKREIDEALSKTAHAVRKARAPRVVAYRLQLTPDELRAVELARGRYAWADMLSAHAAENGAVAFTESEMWQWVDDVDDDGGEFPLASPALSEKLQRFYDSRV